MLKQFSYIFLILIALGSWIHGAEAQDTTAPTVSINTPSGTQTEAFNVTVTFSESVTGFVQSELVVTGSSAATITNWDAQTGGINYVATITPEHDGNVVLNVAANVAEDAATNGNTAATQQTVQVLIPETVWMPDGDLRTLVRDSDHLNISDGTPLTQADMKRAGFTRLTAKIDSNIGDLTGLEYATQLTSIDLADNNITDLTPLAGLTNLIFLQLDENYGITDFSALAGLTELTQLELNYTDIAGDDLASLADQLTGLTDLTLGLRGNYIEDITPLEDLTGLVVLYLHDNDITDLSPLEDLTDLELLDLGSNFSLSDLTPLSSLTNLQELDLSGNIGLSDLTGLESCESLEVLNLKDTHILRDLTPIQDLALTELNIQKTGSEFSYFGHSGPNVSIVGKRSGTTYDVIITFSEAVEDFELTDLEITDGTASSLVELDETDGDTSVEDGTDEQRYDTPMAVYGITMTPNAGVSEVGITLPAGAVQAPRRAALRHLYATRYNAGEKLIIKLPFLSHLNIVDTRQHGADPAQLKEPNTALEAKIDTLSPSVNIIVPDGPHKDPFDVTVKFDERVTGFVQSELVVSGTSGATITHWDAKEGGTDYVATITPTQTGTAIFNVAANVAKDETRNENTAATQQTVQVDKTPPTVSINTPSGAQGGAFDVTVVFSEEVSGFVQSELVVSGTSGASITSWSPQTGGTDYVATITPTQTGTAIFNVAANVAEDAASNGNTMATQQTVQVDMTRPTVRIDVPSGPQGDAFNVTVIFSEEVSGFVQSELVVSGTSGASITDWDAQTGGTNYVATITPTQTGTAIFNVATGVAEDAAENLNTAATQKTVQVDKTPPTVSINTPSGVQGGAFDVTVEFSEEVTGFIQSELVVTGTSGASITHWNAEEGGTNYVATITPTQTGTAIFNVATNVAEDAAENLNTAATQQTVQVDKTPPTVSIDAPSGPQGGAFDVTVVFSEEVSGFVQSELVVSGTSGASITSWSPQTGGTDYVATITPTQTGTAIFNVAANVAKDAAENLNTAATQQTVQVDKTPPTVSIDVPSGPQGGVFDVTVVFSEEVSGFVQSELVVSGTSGASITDWDAETGGTNYVATITPTQTGTAIFNVAANVAKDAAENLNTAATQKTVQVDKTPPTVSINVPSGTQGGTFDVTVVFNEEVTGFVQSELVLTGTSNGSITAWSPQTGGTHYQATVTSTQSGTAIFNVAANVAEDTAKNLNTAATQKTVQVDTDLPSVSIDVPLDPQGGAFDVTVAFNEAVSNFVQSELVVSGTSGASITDWDAQTGGTTYVATITPTQTGTTIFNVAANVAEDAASNGNTMATQQTVQVDMTRPTVRIDVPSGPQGDAFDVTVIFSEEVTGFVQSELVVSGTSGASITDWDAQTGGTNYVATITPTQTGTAIFNVATGVAEDAAENLNTAATQQTVEVDQTRPTVRIDVPSNAQGGTFNVTVVFSETVTGFVQGELVVSGTSGASITSWTPETGGTNYVAMITPSQTGTAIFNVAANVAEDAAANLNTAATQQTVQVDMTRPTVRIDVPSNTQNGAFDVTVIFSESMTGFIQSELIVSGTSGASITSWTPETGGTNYVATITPTQSGATIFNVAANVAEDAAANFNTAATQQTVQIDMTRPTVNINVPLVPQNGVFDVSVEFSEAVTGFVQSELVVSGTSGASITDWDAQTGGTNYVATITPTQTGTAIFNVAANVAQDAVENLNAAATQQTVEVDTIRPEVSIIVPSDEQYGSFDVTVTFTEPVTGFVQSELVVGGTSGASITNWDPQTGSRDYIATITPSQTGMANFNVAENVAMDAAGNLNTAATAKATAVDLDRPHVSLIVPSTPQRETFDVQVTFTEPVNGFTQDDLEINGTSGTHIIKWVAKTDRIDYVATVEPIQSGMVMFYVPENVAEDSAGNLNLPSLQQTVEIDMTRPTVNIRLPADVERDVFEVMVKFSEPVNGFFEDELLMNNPDDVIIIDWEAQLNKQEYVCTMTPKQGKNFPMIFSIEANVARDDAGNGNKPTQAEVFPIDTQAPCLTIEVNQDVQTGPFDANIAFSEPVTGFSQNDLRLGGMLEARITKWRAHDDGANYLATIVPSPLKRTNTAVAMDGGTVTLHVPNGVAVDEADNENQSVAVKTVTVIFSKDGEDTTRPSGTIQTPTDTQAGAFDVTIVFTEPVEDFSQEDLNITPADTNIKNWTSHPDQCCYIATIEPFTSGTVKLNIAENVAMDEAGNGNHAIADKDVEVLFPITADTEKPTVTIAVPTENPSGTFDVNIAFSEPVTGFRQNDLQVSDPCFPITQWQPDPNRQHYTASITPIQDGTVTFSILDRVAQDAFDNWNTAAVVVSVTAEVSPIHAYVEAPTTVRGVFEVTVVFTEPVIGFTQEDLPFADDSTATASITAWDPQPGRTRYTVTFTPTKNGALILTVPANAVETGNTNSEPIKVLISPEDVNQDGLIDLQDLNLVTNNLGAYIPNERENNPDVNRDGFVTSDDLASVQAQIDENSRNAPAGLRTAQSLLEDLKQLGNFDPVLLPKTTALLPNYPNPFNPETWIPYQLSTDSHVRINIYDIYGTPIRFIELGNQSAGYYTDKNHAVYWNGRNDAGERVANGIYFYQLQADDISYLRKMVILK